MARNGTMVPAASGGAGGGRDDTDSVKACFPARGPGGPRLLRELPHSRMPSLARVAGFEPTGTHVRTPSDLTSEDRLLYH